MPIDRDTVKLIHQRAKEVTHAVETRAMVIFDDASKIQIGHLPTDPNLTIVKDRNTLSLQLKPFVDPNGIEAYHTSLTAGRSGPPNPDLMDLSNKAALLENNVDISIRYDGLAGSYKIARAEFPDLDVPPPSKTLFTVGLTLTLDPEGNIRKSILVEGDPRFISIFGPGTSRMTYETDEREVTGDNVNLTRSFVDTLHRQLVTE